MCRQKALRHYELACDILGCLTSHSCSYIALLGCKCFFLGLEHEERIHSGNLTAEPTPTSKFFMNQSIVDSTK